MCTLVSSTSGETEAMTKGLGSETRKLHRQLFLRSSEGLHQVPQPNADDSKHRRGLPGAEERRAVG